jgi:hypothetical protein
MEINMCIMKYYFCFRKNKHKKPRKHSPKKGKKSSDHGSIIKHNKKRSSEQSKKTASHKIKRNEMKNHEVKNSKLLLLPEPVDDDSDTSEDSDSTGNNVKSSNGVNSSKGKKGNSAKNGNYIEDGLGYMFVLSTGNTKV